MHGLQQQSRSRDHNREEQLLRVHKFGAENNDHQVEKSHFTFSDQNGAGSSVFQSNRCGK